MMDIVSNSIVKKKKSRKQIQRIFFDQEIVTKQNATKFINSPVYLPKENSEIDNKDTIQGSKQSRKRKKDNINKVNVKGIDVNIDNTNDVSSKSDVTTKMKRKTSNSIENKEMSAEGVTETSDTKPESIRAQKRKKYVKLLEEKKLKSELTMQQNGLNYLSKWKHSRSQWKFEKLKQIWLQQNMFDSSKIPEEFWDVTVEYFCGAKGAIRSVILKEALKIIETEENTPETDSDEDYQVKIHRARIIVQNLQE